MIPKPVSIARGGLCRPFTYSTVYHSATLHTKHLGPRLVSPDPLQIPNTTDQTLRIIMWQKRCKVLNQARQNARRHKEGCADGTCCSSEVLSPRPQASITCAMVL